MRRFRTVPDFAWDSKRAYLSIKSDLSARRRHSSITLRFGGDGCVDRLGTAAIDARPSNPGPLTTRSYLTMTDGAM